MTPPLGTRRLKTGLILDTNLFVLLVVGLFDPAWIDKHKRTNSYTIEDFNRLKRVVGSYNRLVTLPNVLTEVSNLLAQTSDVIRRGLFDKLAPLIKQTEEIHVPSSIPAKHPLFHTFGLTDLAIAELSGRQYVVLTDDRKFISFLDGLGVETMDFRSLP